MPDFKGISHYHQQLLEHQTTCAGTVQLYLDAIAANIHLNAFVEVYNKEALQKAKELDEQRLAGQPMKKLHGVVIATKDVICFANHKVSAASHILENFTSLYTATALQYLLDEDAIVIGNCNCDEFAMGSTNENSFYGKVLNADDTSKVPGGSSGGSAVAVQAGLCMASLGSDTGGSVRQPANFCNIIGIKPSYGQISRYGLIAYASSFDQIGVLGIHLDDVALILSLMCKPDKMDSTMSTPGKSFYPVNTGSGKKYKFCYFPQIMEHPSLNVEMKKTFYRLFEDLESEGHKVESSNFDLLEYIVPAYYVLTTAEASSNLSRYDGIRYGHQSKNAHNDVQEFYLNNRTEGFGLEVKRRIMLGTFVLSTGYYDAYYSKAQKIRAMLAKELSVIFENFDAILLPASPQTAFDIGQKDKDSIAMYLADIYTVLANLTGVGAVSLPLFSHSNNMPFGLQVMANKQDELTLLSVSNMLLKQYDRRIISLND